MNEDKKQEPTRSQKMRDAGHTRRPKTWDKEQETEMLEAYYRNHWSKLIQGVRVENDTVVITVKGGNDEARCLCGEIINEVELRKENT